MRMYRLKPEAVKFFKDNLATAVKDLDDWRDKYGVDDKALEEVKPMYVTYGIRTSENSSSTCGWSQDDGKHFHFTLNFPSVKYFEHDKFSKGRIVRELMQRMQVQIDYFYEQFLANELEFQEGGSNV